MKWAPLGLRLLVSAIDGEQQRVRVASGVPADKNMDRTWAAPRTSTITILPAHTTVHSLDVSLAPPTMEAMLRKELKDWRRGFRTEHGRDPTRSDMQSHPRMRSVYDTWIALQPSSSSSHKPKPKPDAAPSKHRSGASLSKPKSSSSQLKSAPKAGSQPSTSQRASPLKPAAQPRTPSKPTTPIELAATPQRGAVLAVESPGAASPSMTPTQSHARTRVTYHRSPRSPLKRSPREPYEPLEKWAFTPRTKARKRLRGEQVPLTPVQKRQRTAPEEEEELGATPPPKSQAGRLVPGPRGGGQLVPGPLRAKPKLDTRPRSQPRPEPEHPAPVQLEDLPEEEEDDEEEDDEEEDEEDEADDASQDDAPQQQVEFQEHDVIVHMGTFRPLRRMDEQLAPQDELGWTLGALDWEEALPRDGENQEGQIKEDPAEDEELEDEGDGDEVRRMLHRLDLVSTISPRRGARSQLRRQAEMRVEQLLAPANLSDAEEHWAPKKETVVAPRKTKATKRARIAQVEAEAREAEELELARDEPVQTLIFSRAGRMGVGDAEDDELDSEEWASEVDDDEKGWGDGGMDFDDVI